MQNISATVAVSQKKCMKNPTITSEEVASVLSPVENRSRLISHCVLSLQLTSTLVQYARAHEKRAGLEADPLRS